MYLFKWLTKTVKRIGVSAYAPPRTSGPPKNLAPLQSLIVPNAARQTRRAAGTGGARHVGIGRCLRGLQNGEEVPKVEWQGPLHRAEQLPKEGEAVQKGAQEVPADLRLVRRSDGHW